ncbi:MAG TPA: hypothetical protein PKO12_05865 [Holophaga sp.]|mgnify:CR=1 FL=1|nr:hypothetical protein [Holophaga sp.]
MKIKITTDTHEHQDEKVKPGTVLDVDEPTGKHLISLGAAEPVTTTKE